MTAVDNAIDGAVKPKNDGKDINTVVLESLTKTREQGGNNDLDTTIVCFVGLVIVLLIVLIASICINKSKKPNSQDRVHYSNHGKGLINFGGENV